MNNVTVTQKVMVLNASFMILQVFVEKYPTKKTASHLSYYLDLLSTLHVMFYNGVYIFVINASYREG